MQNLAMLSARARRRLRTEMSERATQTGSRQAMG